MTGMGGNRSQRKHALIEHFRNDPQQDPADRLEMRGAGLDLLRCRVDVAEPPLERGIQKNRARPRLLVGEVGDLSRSVDGVRAGQPHAGARREVDHRAMKGRFTRPPKLSDVPYPVQMEPHLVVEFYSR